MLPCSTWLASHAKNSAAARAAITLILYSEMDRIPSQATRAGAPYDRMRRLPISILPDSVRSLYNVGAFFRAADAAAFE